MRIARHALFFGLLALYLLVVGQNWAHYAAALMTRLWLRYDGELGAVPLTIETGPRYLLPGSATSAMPSGSTPASSVLSSDSEATSNS